MKTNYNVILTLLLVFTVHFTFAQKTITGNVKDESGPLPGVSVLIKGTTTGTETDFDGNYTIQAKQRDVLQYSFIGMETAFKTVGNSNKIDVLMAVSSENLLEEVIINALGIETRQVSRTASISKVDGEQIANSGETSIVKGLSAKSAGVTVTNSSGDPGSSAYVQIRGQTTITRSLQPLYVIDGIPVNNDELGNTVDGTSEQARMNDINPEDVASVKILKGASAAALWGSRAANGVILITTKSGKKGKRGKFNVGLTTKFSFDTPLTRIKLQDKYGKGISGVWNGGSDGGSWGDLIANRSGDENVANSTGSYFVPYNNDGELVLDSNGDPLRIYPIQENNSKEVYDDKNYDAIFGTGAFIETGVTLSSHTDKGNFFSSFSHLDQDGTIGGGDGVNFYERYNFRINAGINISQKVNMKGNFSYSNINSNRIQQGSNLSGLLLGLYRTPADFDNTYYVGTKYNGSGASDMNSHRAYRAQTGTGYKESPNYNNPLWTVYKQKNPNTVNRFIGGFETRFDANDWLQLIIKTGVDSYTDQRVSLFPINSSYPDGNLGIGAVEQNDISYNQYDLSFMGQINKNISEDLRTYYIVGFNANQEDYQERYGGYQDFLIDTDQIIFTNTESDEDTYHGTYSSLKRTNAFYGLADFNYKNLVLLHLTGRVDQSSTFGSDVASFYPSAELGFQFSELVGGDFLNNSKLRLSWGRVGNQPAVYSTTQRYNSAGGGDSYGPSYDSGPYGGAYTPSSVLYQDDLKPEQLTEFEVGFDFKFWNNRINTTVNYYKNETKDALLFIPYNASSGYTFKYANAAQLQNEGYEVELGIDAIKNENFNWRIGANWSTNKNEVISLSEVEETFLNGFVSTTSSAVEGKPLGALWGDRFDRDENNVLILDDNGFPTMAEEQGYLGDPNPDWKANFNTALSYKNFSLSGVFDVSMGGKTWNGTQGALTFFGRTPQTANEVTISAADALLIKNFDGVFVGDIPYANENADGSYTVRGNIHNFGDGDVLLDEAWYTDFGGGFAGSSEQFIDDASWAKLRELSLDYSFESKLFKDSFIESVNLRLTGRNLWLWTEDDLDYDPESNLTGASNGRGLQYFNHPTNKSYLATIKINF